MTPRGGLPSAGEWARLVLDTLSMLIFVDPRILCALVMGSEGVGVAGDFLLRPGMGKVNLAMAAATEGAAAGGEMEIVGT